MEAMWLASVTDKFDCKMSHKINTSELYCTIQLIQEHSVGLFFLGTVCSLICISL